MSSRYITSQVKDHFVARDKKGKRSLSHHLQLQGSGGLETGVANSVKRLRIWMKDTEARDFEDEVSDSDISMVD
jgi:hypothetical protein